LKTDATVQSARTPGRIRPLTGTAAGKKDQGKCSTHYAEQATCKHCSLIWLWFSGEVPGCHWFWHWATDNLILHSCSVYCGDYINFECIEHPHLGHCTKGKPEAIAGLWDTGWRYCERFLPKPK